MYIRPPCALAKPHIHFRYSSFLVDFHSILCSSGIQNPYFIRMLASGSGIDMLISRSLRISFTAEARRSAITKKTQARSSARSRFFHKRGKVDDLPPNAHTAFCRTHRRNFSRVIHTDFILIQQSTGCCSHVCRYHPSTTAIRRINSIALPLIYCYA